MADPSPLTTAQILREISSLKELVFTRMNAMDKAMTLFNDNITRVPTDVDKQVGTLKALVYETFKTFDARLGTVGEQFASIANEFRLRNENDKQQAIDRKEELKTALSAAEKAVDKSGNATGDLLRQQVELLRSTKEGLDGRLGELQVRLATAEANASAAKEAAAAATSAANAAIASKQLDHTAQQVDRGFSAYVWVTVVMGLVAVAALAVAILKP